MKKVILITLFCYCFITKGVSQSYFNSRYNFYNKSNSTEQFILVKDTFYLPTIIFDTAVPYMLYKASVTKIKLDGNNISVSKFNSNKGVYNIPVGLTHFNNYNYLVGSGGFPLQQQYSLTKLNYKSDTLYNKISGDTGYYNNINKIIPYYKTKNKLLLIGVTDSTCGPGHQGLYKPIIRVVDTNGVLYQTKIYLSDCKYRNITSIDTSENKGYLIGYGGDNTTWQVDARIIKLDSNLNIIWNKQINISSNGEPNIVNHKNQYYTVVSTKVDSVWNFTYKWERVSLTRLDLNGNIIWQKYYGVKERPMITSGLKECANGDYVMCGTRRTAYNELQGWIMRTDSIGNLKWWRNYRPNTTPILDTVADNYLHDIMELPNGDIAAVGWAGGTSINPLQQTWLLKVDSNGCFGVGACNPNLATGIDEILNENELILNIYPNPFTNNITISYTLLNSNKTNVEINLIEIASGKLISKQTSSKNENTIKFDTENLPSGVYLVNIRNNGVSLRNTKVINIK